MNDTAILGFGIPTYRRPEHLHLALQSIVPQARNIGAPIYIPDNSCDETNVAVVKSWQSVYPHIIHEINEENLGIDRNVDRAIVRCPATYVLVIGDDDVVLPGFVDTVTAVIADLAPGHIVCSYQYLANDYRPITGNAVIPSDRCYSSMRSLLPHHGWALGFIGAHVFRRDRFAAGTSSGFGTYFHHLVRLINYMTPDETIGFVGKPLVGNRADDESTPTWSADRLAVIYGLEKSLVDAMRPDYSSAEILRTVTSTRGNMGYTQFFRLLYWAALADASGNGAKYWETLAEVASSLRYKLLRAVPRALYPPLLRAIPWVRSAKRRAGKLQIIRN